MKMTKVMANLSRRFKSDDCTPVERAYITREEWEALQKEVEGLIIFQETTLLREMNKEEGYEH
jgi:hypothetical protein